MSEKIYLNGKLIPKNEASISPEDRGFNFADGIYEVIKYYGGKPFRYADHKERLRRSLREIQIDFEDFDQLEPVFQAAKCLRLFKLTKNLSKMASRDQLRVLFRVNFLS